MGALVTYELDDAVANLRMDDGKVNVMSRQMPGSVNDALDRVQSDGATVLLTRRPRRVLGRLRHAGARRPGARTRSICS